ncbi:MAG: hypothetical protein Q7S38_01860 [bacterium]|nr:hypothetical protein [bacterium]
MGSIGGFYKGEKKKKKKGEGKPGSSGFLGSLGQPVFTLPKVISKKKKEY